MILYPAIDLLDGQCVRLHKGDFVQKTIYGDDPTSVAQDFQNQGANWLHLVDLSGTKDPTKRQIKTISEIIKKTGLQVQTGGGIRKLEDAMALLDAGAARVIIGSLAVKNIDITKGIFSKIDSNKICLALDGIDGNISVSGWQEETKISLTSVIDTYIPFGLTHILSTDINRDGTMAGPNMDLYRNLVSSYPSLQIQASGGIGNILDIKELVTTGVKGAIAGKAIYEGKFTVSKGVEVAKSC